MSFEISISQVIDLFKTLELTIPAPLEQMNSLGFVFTYNYCYWLIIAFGFLLPSLFNALDKFLKKKKIATEGNSDSEKNENGLHFTYYSLLFLSSIVVFFFYTKTLVDYKYLAKNESTLKINSDLPLLSHYRKQNEFLKENLFSFATNEKQRAVIYFCNETNEYISETLQCINGAKLPK